MRVSSSLLHVCLLCFLLLAGCRPAGVTPPAANPAALTPPEAVFTSAAATAHTLRTASAPPPSPTPTPAPLSPYRLEPGQGWAAPPNGLQWDQPGLRYQVLDFAVGSGPGPIGWDCYLSGAWRTPAIGRRYRLYETHTLCLVGFTPGAPLTLEIYTPEGALVARQPLDPPAGLIPLQHIRTGSDTALFTTLEHVNSRIDKYLRYSGKPLGLLQTIPALAYQMVEVWMPDNVLTPGDWRLRASDGVQQAEFTLTVEPVEGPQVRVLADPIIDPFRRQVAKFAPGQTVYLAGAGYPPNRATELRIFYFADYPAGPWTLDSDQSTVDVVSIPVLHTQAHADAQGNFGVQVPLGPHDLPGRYEVYVTNPLTGKRFYKNEFTLYPDLQAAQAPPPGRKTPTPAPPGLPDYPVSVQAHIPITSEIGSVPSLWRRLDFQDLAQPGQREYQTTISAGETWMWTFRWCASDEVFTHSTAELAPYFWINDLDVDRRMREFGAERHHQVDMPMPNKDGWRCRLYAVKLDHFLPNSQLKLTIAYELSRDLSDGQATYPAGLYQQIIRLDVQ